MYKTLYTVLVSFLTISVATGLTAAEYKGPNLSGQTISIAGPWLTGDEGNFDKVNAYFEKQPVPKWTMPVRIVLSSRS